MREEKQSNPIEPVQREGNGAPGVVITRSNPVAPDPRVEKTSRVLHGKGYRVSIVAWDRSGQLVERESLEDIHIQRLPIIAEYGRGLANLIPLVRWQVELLRWLWTHRDEYKVIHACDFDTVLPAIVMLWLKNKKVVYDVFDFYADMLRATPEWIKRLVRKVDLWAMGRVDGVVLVDHCRLEQIQGSHPKSLAVVYNTPEDIADELAESTRFDKPESQLHIVFVGLLQVERGLFELLDVLEKHPEWSLDIAGFGGDQRQIVERAKERKNVRIFGRMAYQDALALNQTADVLFAMYDPSILNHRYASPNKLFEAMMLGKPIVVARGTGMDRIVASEGCGIVVPYGEHSSLEQALMELANQPDLRETLGSAARQAYEEKYGWRHQKSTILKFYANL